MVHLPSPVLPQCGIGAPSTVLVGDWRNGTTRADPRSSDFQTPPTRSLRSVTPMQYAAWGNAHEPAIGPDLVLCITIWGLEFSRIQQHLATIVFRYRRVPCFPAPLAHRLRM